MSKISRREFIHMSGLAVAGVTLAACAKATEESVEPTAAPKAEATATTAAAVPSSTTCASTGSTWSTTA